MRPIKAASAKIRLSGRVPASNSSMESISQEIRDACNEEADEKEENENHRETQSVIKSRRHSKHITSESIKSYASTQSEDAENVITQDESERQAYFCSELCASALRSMQVLHAKRSSSSYLPGLNLIKKKKNQ